MGIYITSPNQVTPIPGSLEAIKELRLKGHKLVILTNQAGISKGLQTEKQVDDVHTHLLNVFGQNGIQSIDAIYYSMTNLKEDVFAKPNIGMFNRAKEEQTHLTSRHLHEHAHQTGCLDRCRQHH